MEFDPKLRSIYAPEKAKPGQRVELGEHNGVSTYAKMPLSLEQGQILLFRMPESKRAPVEVTIEKGEGSTLGLSLEADDVNSHPRVRDISSEGVAKDLVKVGDLLTHISGTSATASVKGALLGTQKPAEMLRKATGTLRLSILREMPQEALLVHKHGLLSKRSPKSVAGMRAWQQRYFELSPERLTYYELVVCGTPSGEPTIGKSEKGAIALSELVGVREHQSSPKRFDLLMKNKRMFELNAFSDTERKEWAVAIQQALLGALTAASSAVSLEESSKGSASAAGEEDAMSSAVDEGEVAADGGDDLTEASRTYTVSTKAKPVSVEAVTGDNGQVAFFRM